MKNLFVTFLFAFAFTLIPHLSFGADAVDLFAKYPATKTVVPLKKKHAKVTLSGPLAQKYHTVLADELTQGPNFARHYRVVQIGCGASCSMIAIIDTLTGRVHDPQIIVTIGLDTADLGDRVQFQLKSRLLVLHGCLNEQSNRCGTHLYLFNAGMVKPLKFIPAPKKISL